MELAWVTSPKLPMRRRPVRPGDLTRHQVITNPEPSKLITVIRDWFATAGLEPSRLSACNSLAVIARLTAAGAGVSVLPVSILGEEFRRGLLIALVAQPALAPQRLFAGYQADQTGPGINAILRIAREVLARTHLLAP